MKESVKSQVSDAAARDLACVMFGIGVDAGRALVREISQEQANIAAAEKQEIVTEGRIYPRRQPRDE